jgi:hypothetical protein
MKGNGEKWEKEGINYEYLWHSAGDSIISEMMLKIGGSTGHFCGYAEIEGDIEGSDWNGLLAHLPIRGGITYVQRDNGTLRVGFDTGHREGLNDENITVEWVKAECERLGRMLKTAQEMIGYGLPNNGITLCQILSRVLQEEFDIDISDAGNVGGILRLFIERKTS